MIDLEEKRVVIERFFKDTGSSYDEVVDRFTFGIDRRWKRKMLSRIPTPEKALDLACGTGILTFSIKEKFPNCKITGVDITEGYLKIAREKSSALNMQDITFVHSSAEDFLTTEFYNLIISCYLPKYADIPRLIHQLSQMLASDGIILLHDFTYPSSKILQLIFELYFKCAQAIGSWVYPEWKEVLQELPGVIRKTTWVDEVTTAMAAEGLSDIQVESFTLQGSALVSAKKSA